MERLKYLIAGSEQSDPLIRALLAGGKPSFLCLRDERGREEEWELFAVLPFQGELYAEIGRRNDGAGTHLFCRMGHGSEDFILYPEHTAATVSALMAIKNQQREVPSRPASAGCVHITGDTHGDISRFFVGQPTEETGWSARDTLIVCGDFGYIFSADRFEERLLDLLEQKPYTICFCDGNHDHIPAICSYPETQWNGGRAHRIRRNLYHLMRGQVYEINGKSFFTMGGAYSLDRQRRQEGVSFWHEECHRRRSIMRRCKICAGQGTVWTASSHIRHPEIFCIAWVNIRIGMRRSSRDSLSGSSMTFISGNGFSVICTRI